MSHLAPNLAFQADVYALCSRPTNFAVPEPAVSGHHDNGYQQDGLAKWREDPEMWKARLLATWDAVERELVKREVKVIPIPSHPDLPDQCFMADSVAVFHKQLGPNSNGTCYVIPSNMNSANRQREVPVAIEFLKEIQFSIPIDPMQQGKKHEGTGDLLYLPGFDFYIQGYGPRSESGIGATISQVSNQLVVEVPLLVESSDIEGGLASNNTKGFHLDTIVMPLPGKRIVACFERMHPETRTFFEKLYPPENRIELTSEQADLFVTNGLCVPAHEDDKSKNGYTLFMPDAMPVRIENKLKEWGFGTLKFDFEPSKLSGGGLHCMFNFVFRVNQAPAKILTIYNGPNGEANKWCEALGLEMTGGIKLYSPWQEYAHRQRKPLEIVPA